MLVSPTFVPRRWAFRTQPSDGGGQDLVKDKETVDVFRNVGVFRHKVMWGGSRVW